MSKTTKTYSHLPPEQRIWAIKARNRELQKRWRLANPDKLAAQQERAKERKKLKDSDKFTGKRKIGESFYDYICRKWGSIRATKKAAGREFSIWPDDIEYPVNCPVLGTPIDYEGHSYEEAWSLDCLDPEKGYVKGNVHIISRRANRIKNDGTALEHEKIASWMRSKK